MCAKARDKTGNNERSFSALGSLRELIRPGQAVKETVDG